MLRTPAARTQSLKCTSDERTFAFVLSWTRFPFSQGRRAASPVRFDEALSVVSRQLEEGSRSGHFSLSAWLQRGCYSLGMAVSLIPLRFYLWHVKAPSG